MFEMLRELLMHSIPARILIFCCKFISRFSLTRPSRSTPLLGDCNPYNPPILTGFRGNNPFPPGVKYLPAVYSFRHMKRMKKYENYPGDSDRFFLFLQ